ncbi:MAG TPA: TadE/TadG family type IV pilus assembly protein [Jatrophihabitans sp.]|jgi:Flp pilus assembly protein TadG
MKLVRLVRERCADDRGSSVAEFAMVSTLLVFLLFGILQVAALFYVRSVAAAAASDGARYAANAGVDPTAGGERASRLIQQATTLSMAQQLPCRGTKIPDPASGLSTARVRCRGQIHSILIPLGALVTIDVTGQSLQEQQQ